MAVAELEARVMWKLDTGRMRDLREAANLTQTAAAGIAGMSPSRWSDIESGGRSNVTVETLGAVADAIGCHPSELLRSVGRPKKPDRR